MNAPIDIIRTVSDEYGLPVSEILGRCRTLQIAEARQMAMMLVWQLFGMKYVEIGKLFGRNHATVIYAIKSIRWRLQYDKSLKAKYNSIISRLD